MRKQFLLAFAGVVAVATVASGQARPAPLTVVPELDYSRYAGTWFEIARLPNHAQRLCSTDVTATYEARADGRLDVTNRCREKNGNLIEVSGVARPVGGHPPSSLQVRLGPGLLSFLPGVWEDYQVLELGEQYEFAVVGTPDRKHLWVLSRQPWMDDALLRDLATRARAQAFDVDQLTMTRHTTS